MQKQLLKLIIVGIFSVSSLVYSRAPGTYFQLKNDINSFSQKNLVDLLNEFIKESAPSRFIGTPGHEKSREFLVKKINQLDSKKTGKLNILEFSPNIDVAKNFYQMDFDSKVEGKIPKNSSEYIKWLKFTQYMKNKSEELKNILGKNIVWEKSGINSNKVLVITAHYDTVTHNPQTLTINDKEIMPGANYNASGVTVALAILKVLASIDLNYSVRVVFLDWQSLAFLGSYEYAQVLKNSKEEILGIINLEMLGQDTSFKDRAKKLGNFSVYTQEGKIQFAQELNAHGERIDNKISFEIKPGNFESSDNVRFWENNLNCVTYSQNWEDDFNPKFYQSALDTPETLNHETLHHAYQFIGGAVGARLLDITK